MGIPTEFVHRPSLSDLGKGMLGAGLVLLVSAGVMLLAAENKLRQSNAEVQRANAALLQIAEINTRVVAIDLSARGYALTGNPVFVGYENNHQNRLRQAVDNLAGLLAGEPGGPEAMARLKALVKVDAAVFSDFVAKGPGHSAEIARIITDPKERQKRYDVQLRLVQMRSEQLTRLRQYQTEAEQQQRFTSILTFAIIAVAFLGGTTDVVARLLRRRIHRRAKFAAN